MFIKTEGGGGIKRCVCSHYSTVYFKPFLSNGNIHLSGGVSPWYIWSTRKSSVSQCVMDMELLNDRTGTGTSLALWSQWVFNHKVWDVLTDFLVKDYVGLGNISRFVIDKGVKVCLREMEKDAPNARVACANFAQLC